MSPNSVLMTVMLLTSFHLPLKPISLLCLGIFLMINFAHEHIQRSTVYAVATIKSLIHTIDFPGFRVHDRTGYNLILITLDVMPQFSGFWNLSTVLGIKQPPLLLYFRCLFHHSHLKIGFLGTSIPRPPLSPINCLLLPYADALHEAALPNPPLYSIILLVPFIISESINLFLT